MTGVLVRGGFGWIRRGRLNNGLSIAIKVLQPRDLSVQSVEDSRVGAADQSMLKNMDEVTFLFQRFRNEVNIWSRLRHENILPLLGLVELSIENVEETGLASPWEQNGNVKDFYQKNPDLDRLPMVSSSNYWSNVSGVILPVFQDQRHFVGVAVFAQTACGARRLTRRTLLLDDIYRRYRLTVLR